MPSDFDVDLLETTAEGGRGHTPTPVKNPNNAPFGAKRMLAAARTEISLCEIYSCL